MSSHNTRDDLDESVPPRAVCRYNKALNPRRLCMRHSMNTMRLLLLSSTLSVFALAGWADAKVAPATKPTTKPAVSRPAGAQSAEAKANAAVARAVAALKKE